MKRLHGPRGAANLSLVEEKEALRRRMRTLRRRLWKTYPDAASEAVLQYFSRSGGVSPALALPEDAGETPALRLRVVAGYSPQGSEVEPKPMIEAFAMAGWTPSLPRAASRDGPLSFHTIDGPLAPDAFGIPAPLPTAPRVSPNLLLVPVLAFDRFGGRLGQGAGCYDRTIAALRASGPLWVVGMAFAGQEVGRVPTDPHDQPLDAILTETGYREVLKTS